MARSISEEEIQLKKRARRRLVGAVVLVTVVAVVLPMVLDTEPKSVNQNVDIQIPSPDAGSYNPKVAPPPAAPGSKTVPAVPSAPSQPATATSQATTEVPASAPAAVPSRVEKKESSTTSEAAPKRSAKAPESPNAGESGKAGSAGVPKAVSTGKFVVQIAALADAAKAKQLQQQVAHDGIKAYTEVVKTAKGSVTRVRVGPYATRDAAEKVRAHLKAAGLDGKVVPK